MLDMNRNLRLRTLAGLVAAVAVLGACSSSSDNDSAQSTPQSTSTAVGQPSDSTSDGDRTAAAGLTSTYLGSYSLEDPEFGTMVTVVVDGGTRTIETNALPDHETGEFPNSGNPNTITAQDLTWEFPATAVYTGQATEVRVPGVAVNGVKFEPGTAETVTCSSGEVYRIEALQDIYDLGLDFNNAHVQPTGEYHYHGISSMLVDAYDTDQDLVHVGFAADGHLMYYSKSGAYESGYALSSTARSGTGCQASGPAGGTTIELEGSTPDGTYTTDWQWSDQTGDLDECNGITIDGQYVYIVTNDYPYISRCTMGEASGDGVGGPPGPGAGGSPSGQGAGGSASTGDA